MSRNNISARSSGFTLIEILVIAPISMLIITGFVALMVAMVGDVVANRTHNVMTYDTQSALNTIERDVRLSTQFLTTTGTMPTPQGKNGATSAFTSTSGDLILGEIATDKNPIDPTRGFIYYNAPFSCSDPVDVYKNRLFFTTVIYTIRDGSLWRRTYVPSPSGTLCKTPWQVNTCEPGYSGLASRCDTNDSEILKNVKSFDITYYENPQDSVALSDASASSASSIVVTLESEKTAAGRTVTVGSSARSTKLSDKDIALTPPDPPVVTGSHSGADAIFTWSSVPRAESYIVRYSINGGTWTTASENTTETIFSLAVNRGDTVSVKVFARNTTGASADTASNSTSVTVPLWTPCSLQYGWVNYGAGYDDCGYTITKDGVVMFKGHIKVSAVHPNMELFQLPESFRPSTRLMFQALIAPNSTTRLDVNDDGWVRLANGTSTYYVGLDGIYFVPKDSLYTWTAPTLLNGWSAFSSSWPTLQTTKDDSGRVHLKGLIKPGSITYGIPIAQLPTGSRVSEYYHFPARGDAYNFMGIDANGRVVFRGINTAYYSTQAMFYPSTYTDWNNFTGTVSGTPADGQLGSNWVAYGGGYPTPAYTKSDDGIVTLKGLIRSGSTVDNSYMARLPAGYCPRDDKTLAFTVAASGGGDGPGRIDIGRISGQPSCYLVYRAGGNTWMSLSSISYLAEP